MLPKVIHYCWFGRKPLPESALRCISSWKRYLPDYQIMEWNEENFDVDSIPYTSEAYSVGKYAFVSDYARLWVLYRYGGLYFDVDVELIAGIDDIVSRGSFMAYEHGYMIAPGLGLGLESGMPLLKRLLSEYESLHFLKDGQMLMSKTIVNIVTDMLRPLGIERYADGIDRVDGLFIYHQDYFAPLDHISGVLTLTDNSRAIHHYDASWKTPGQKFKDKIIRLFGPGLTRIMVKIKRLMIGKNNE